MNQNKNSKHQQLENYDNISDSGGNTHNNAVFKNVTLRNNSMEVDLPNENQKMFSNIKDAESCASPDVSKNLNPPESSQFNGSHINKLPLTKSSLEMLAKDGFLGEAKSTFDFYCPARISKRAPSTSSSEFSYSDGGFLSKFFVTDEEREEYIAARRKRKAEKESLKLKPSKQKRVDIDPVTSQPHSLNTSVDRKCVEFQETEYRTVDYNDFLQPEKKRNALNNSLFGVEEKPIVSNESKKSSFSKNVCEASSKTTPVSITDLLCDIDLSSLLVHSSPEEKSLLPSFPISSSSIDSSKLVIEKVNSIVDCSNVVNSSATIEEQSLTPTSSFTISTSVIDTNASVPQNVNPIVDCSNVLNSSATIEEQSFTPTSSFSVSTSVIDTNASVVQNVNLNIDSSVEKSSAATAEEEKEQVCTVSSNFPVSTSSVDLTVSVNSAISDVDCSSDINSVANIEEESLTHSFSFSTSSVNSSATVTQNMNLNANFSYDKVKAATILEETVQDLSAPFSFSVSTSSLDSNRLVLEKENSDINCSNVTISTSRDEEESLTHNLPSSFPASTHLVNSVTSTAQYSNSNVNISNEKNRATTDVEENILTHSVPFISPISTSSIDSIVLVTDNLSSDVNGSSVMTSIATVAEEKLLGRSANFSFPVSTSLADTVVSHANSIINYSNYMNLAATNKDSNVFVTPSSHQEIISKTKLLDNSSNNSRVKDTISKEQSLSESSFSQIESDSQHFVEVHSINKTSITNKFFPSDSELSNSVSEEIDYEKRANNKLSAMSSELYSKELLKARTESMPDLSILTANNLKASVVLITEKTPFPINKLSSSDELDSQNNRITLNSKSLVTSDITSTSCSAELISSSTPSTQVVEPNYESSLQSLNISESNSCIDSTLKESADDECSKASYNFHVPGTHDFHPDSKTSVAFNNRNSHQTEKIQKSCIDIDFTKVNSERKELNFSIVSDILNSNKVNASTSTSEVELPNLTLVNTISNKKISNCNRTNFSNCEANNIHCSFSDSSSFLDETNVNKLNESNALQLLSFSKEITKLKHNDNFTVDDVSKHDANDRFFSNSNKIDNNANVSNASHLSPIFSDTSNFNTNDEALSDDMKSTDVLLDKNMSDINHKSSSISSLSPENTLTEAKKMELGLVKTLSEANGFQIANCEANSKLTGARKSNNVITSFENLDQNCHPSSSINFHSFFNSAQEKLPSSLKKSESETPALEIIDNDMDVADTFFSNTNMSQNAFSNYSTSDKADRDEISSSETRFIEVKPQEIVDSCNNFNSVAKPQKSRKSFPPPLRAKAKKSFHSSCIFTAADLISNTRNLPLVHKKRKSTSSIISSDESTSSLRNSYSKLLKKRKQELSENSIETAEIGVPDISRVYSNPSNINDEDQFSEKVKENSFVETSEQNQKNCVDTVNNSSDPVTDKLQPKYDMEITKRIATALEMDEELISALDDETFLSPIDTNLCSNVDENLHQKNILDDIVQKEESGMLLVNDQAKSNSSEVGEMQLSEALVGDNIHIQQAVPEGFDENNTAPCDVIQNKETISDVQFDLEGSVHENEHETEVDNNATCDLSINESSKNSSQEDNVTDKDETEPAVTDSNLILPSEMESTPNLHAARKTYLKPFTAAMKSIGGHKLLNSSAGGKTALKTFANKQLNRRLYDASPNDIIKDGSAIYIKKNSSANGSSCEEISDDDTKVPGDWSSQDLIHSKSFCTCSKDDVPCLFDGQSLQHTCEAEDTVNGSVVPCFRTINQQSLLTPSSKVKFRLFCDNHLWRLKHHHCCPCCGIFCTQGKFLMCQCENVEKNNEEIHLFHTDCYLVPRAGLPPGCPHCCRFSKFDKVQLTFKTSPEEPNKIDSAVRNLTSHLKDYCISMKILNAENEKSSETMKFTIPEKEELKSMLMAISDKCLHLRPTGKCLYNPIKIGDVKKVLQLLVNGVNPNHKFKTHKNNTPLHIAAYFGFTGIVHVLLQYGGEINAVNDDLETPLILAVERKHIAVVRYLICVGADINAKTENGLTAFHAACKSGCKEIAQLLYDVGSFDINIQDDGGWTPLVWSCEYKFLNVVLWLLELGADPNIRDSELNIASHWAACSGESEILNVLLDNGCSLGFVNKRGDTALHIAARKGHYSCVRLLLERGAPTDSKNEDGETPLMCCDVGTKSYRILKKYQSLVSKKKRAPLEHVVFRDISLGLEKYAIQVVNEIDSEEFVLNFRYVIKNCQTSDIKIITTIDSMKWCPCKSNCGTGDCACGPKCWYDINGCLVSEFDLDNPPSIYECHKLCHCPISCINRVVQKGLRTPLQVFRTLHQGWGVRSLKDLSKGAFICEYIGELIKGEEVPYRDDTYIFDLNSKDGDYCLDGRFYGNVARFFNHSCEPNLVALPVYMQHQDQNFPHIALFATRDIPAFEELCFDYGQEFWISKSSTTLCTCQSPSCKYSKDTIDDTLYDIHFSNQIQVSPENHTVDQTSTMPSSSIFKPMNADYDMHSRHLNANNFNAPSISEHRKLSAVEPIVISVESEEIRDKTVLNIVDNEMDSVV